MSAMRSSLLMAAISGRARRWNTDASAGSGRAGRERCCAGYTGCAACAEAAGGSLHARSGPQVLTNDFTRRFARETLHEETRATARATGSKRVLLMLNHALRPPWAVQTD